MKVNSIFSDPQFWKTYENLFLEGEIRSGSKEWLNKLKNDFNIETRQVPYLISPKELQENAIAKGLSLLYKTYQEGEYQSRWKALKESKKYALIHFTERTEYFETTKVIIDFPLPLLAKLRLEIEIDLESHCFPEQDLYLVFKDKKHHLGFWDTAHWMPYCLQLEELEKLSEYLNNSNGYWKNKGELAFSLLAKFIGIDSEEESFILNTIYGSILSKRGLETNQTFNPQTKCCWIKTKQGQEFVSTEVPPQLRHLVQQNIAVHLPSYSFRKQNYTDVIEFPQFPFREWETIFKHI